jgi:hypothetical protein
MFGEVACRFVRSACRASAWSVFVCLLTVARAATACDPCGMHSAVQVPGLLNALRTTGLQPGALTVGAQEQFSTFRVRGENNLRTTETDLELIRNLSVTQASLAYNISSEVALQVNAPFVVRNYDRFERFRKVRDSEAGLGDSSVLTTYSPYSFTDVDSRVFVAGMAGIKLPTGDTGSLTRVASEDGAPADVRIQGRGLTLGSGSVDMPLGVMTYVRSGRLQVFGSAQYTFRTEGAADYRFANDLVWSTAPGWLFLIGEEQSLACSVVFSGEHKGSDHLDGDLLPRTAMSNLYLGPELFYAISNRLSLQVGVDLPLALDVGGAAVKPETRSRMAISWSF